MDSITLKTLWYALDRNYWEKDCVATDEKIIIIMVNKDTLTLPLSESFREGLSESFVNEAFSLGKIRDFGLAGVDDDGNIQLGRIKEKDKGGLTYQSMFTYKLKDYQNPDELALTIIRDLEKVFGIIDQF